MRKEIQEIISSFNNEINKIDKRKLILYNALMEYREEYCKILRIGGEYCGSNIEQLNNKWVEIFKKSKIYDGMISNFDEMMKYIKVETAEIEDLLYEFKCEIKNFYLDNGISLSSVVPGVYDTLKRSENILNQYEREIGDWVFASSQDDDKNVYRLRSSGSGMYRLEDNRFILWGNNLEEKDELLFVNEPSYSYKLKSDKFMPVVSFALTRDGYGQVLFDDEWTSDQDLEKDDIEEITQIQNVTDVLRNVNILSISNNRAIEQVKNILRDRNMSKEEKKFEINKLVEMGWIIDWNKKLHIECLSSNENELCCD